MSDATPYPRTDGLRAVVLISYGLFLLALTNGLSAIAAIILVYIKRADAAGTLWASHFRNMIVVFWVAVVLSAVATAILLPGAATLIWSLIQTDGHPPPDLMRDMFASVPLFALTAFLFGIWYLYRIIRGFVRAIEGEPY